jgi:hypothetical protein
MRDKTLIRRLTSITDQIAATKRGPIGLRGSPGEKGQGLDMTEHGGTVYPDFEVSSYAQQ